MKYLSCIGAAILLFGAVACSKSKTEIGAAPEVEKKSTYKDVSAIITTSCGTCHSGPNAKRGLDVSSYASVMHGDKEDKVVRAGDSKRSRLATVLHGTPKLMPPTAALPANQIALIEKWIDDGAKQ